jgi:hypothetical protein
MIYIKFIFKMISKFIFTFYKKLFQLAFYVIKIFQNILFKILNPSVKLFHNNYFGTYHTKNGVDLYLTSLLFNNLISNEENLIVEVGISGPSFLSKSLIFESHFNCKVINIGLINQYKDLWESERPNSIFISHSIDTSKGFHELKLDYRNPYLMDLNFFSSNYHPIDYLNTTVNTRALTEILGDFGYNEVLILFLDFNFYDLNAIYKIDLNNLYVKCICLSLGKSSLYNHLLIKNYLKNNGFKYDARIGDGCDIFIRYSLINGIEISDLM